MSPLADRTVKRLPVNPLALTVLWMVLFAWIPGLEAHTLSTAFLTLRESGTELTGEWHLALRDLEDAVGLDTNDDGLITWDELRAQQSAVNAYALSRLHIRNQTDEAILHLTDLLVENHSDGCYAVVRFDAPGFRFNQAVQIDYRAMFDVDLKHRCLLRFEREGKTILGVFTPESATQHFNLSNTGPIEIQFHKFVLEGVWHIWQGYDHILFLLALLLPGVMRRAKGHWEPVSAIRPAISNVIKIVTAFTVAHSITLSLAVIGGLQLPPRLIEPAIAFSVIVVALNNLFPIFPERGWLAAFGFGLLHGFGFANALTDLGLRHVGLAVGLFGFNFGVELGQLAIVALFLPPALLLRRVLFYPRVVLRLGSVGIVLIAAAWLAERILDFKWLPF